MTNGEKIQTILDIDKDCTEVYGKNGMMTFSVPQDWWNAEYKEPTTKNDLAVDCISREQAKVAIRDKFKDLPSRVEINTILNELPSVTPQPRKGHWIPTYGNVKCSVCGSVKDSRDVGRATHYCDFCGAKMESEE